jgi:Ca-activated chloride channel family protein
MSPLYRLLVPALAVPLTVLGASQPDPAIVLETSKGMSGPVQAHRPVVVEELEVHLEAPRTAAIASVIQVAWSGPGLKHDFITLVPTEADRYAIGNHTYTRRGSPLALTMPVQPGHYEIRYVTGQDRRVLARRQIRVREVEVRLEAPPSGPIGGVIQVAWKGPDARHDFVTVAPAGATDRIYGHYTYTRKGSPLALRLPVEPGDYEIRYVTGQDRRVLARIPLQVAAVEISLEAPPSGGIGTLLAVAWRGPDARHDVIAVAPSGSPSRDLRHYAYTRNGSPARVPLPETPGQYEIRYVTGEGKHILATRPVRVEAVEARLQAPASAPIGSAVSVAWSGPGNRQDLIGVAEAGSPDRQSKNFVRTRGGSPANLKLPDRPGSYEIRYLTGEQRHVLARAPIEIEDVPATLEAPADVTPDSAVPIHWSGPDGHRDYIALALPEAPDNRYLAKATTRNGSPLKIRSPRTPGEFELRYVTGQSRRVLARRPLRVVGVGE